ncbi:MAG TPA: helix-turn-helix domain-containing protein [Burkholderiaceae bacterium]|nr:helix-turn-helix domain-containing protein [Burkholderiaceae bacterium]
MFDSVPSSGSAGERSAEIRARTIEPHSPDRRDTNWNSVKLADLAALLGIALPADPRFVDATFSVRSIRAGDVLHRAGDPFRAIYVVRSGFFKTISIDTAGGELVLGFPMAGDVIGLDGVDSNHYLTEVAALDISSVAVIPFAQLAQLAREHACVERLLYSLFSRELVHKHAMFWLLGTLSADARLASFLLEMSDRFGRLGYSRTSFALRATRQEIGSYLGLKLETVSRTLSAFAAAGLVEIDRRQVTLRDIAGLRRIVDPALAASHERGTAHAGSRTAQHGARAARRAGLMMAA